MMRPAFLPRGRKTSSLPLALLSVLWLAVSAALAGEPESRLQLREDLEPRAEKPKSSDIWHAAGRGGVEDIRWFLSRDRELVNRLDEDGFAPLHKAACGGQANAARFLCQSGADPNVQQGVFKGTPLQYAATYGNTQVIRVLLENGARVDATDTAGRTPLMWAVMGRNTEAARLFLDRGADVNARSKMGTALHLAVGQGHANTAKLLIDRGADTATRDRSGRTPADLNPAGLVLPDGSRADENDPNYLQRRKLEGSWEVISSRLDGNALADASLCRFTFEDAEVTVVEKTKSIKSRYGLDVRKEPKRFTLSALSGRSRVNGAYSLERNTLVLCLALQPNGPAPTELETTEGDRRLLLTLRRMPGLPSDPQENGRTDPPN
ncbi:MAG: ankyrin repeat domain-containing protein [Planctomycetota bacterium]|jgi:uncharacterized protein (TIGR03067 family)